MMCGVFNIGEDLGHAHRVSRQDRRGLVLPNHKGKHTFHPVMAAVETHRGSERNQVVIRACHPFNLPALLVLIHHSGLTSSKAFRNIPGEQVSICRVIEAKVTTSL